MPSADPCRHTNTETQKCLVSGGDRRGSYYLLSNIRNRAPRPVISCTNIGIICQTEKVKEILVELVNLVASSEEEVRSLQVSTTHCVDHSVTGTLGIPQKPAIAT
jgi:hypothetical protein